MMEHSDGTDSWGVEGKRRTPSSLTLLYSPSCLNKPPPHLHATTSLSVLLLYSACWPACLLCLLRLHLSLAGSWLVEGQWWGWWALMCVYACGILCVCVFLLFLLCLPVPSRSFNFLSCVLRWEAGGRRKEGGEGEDMSPQRPQLSFSAVSSSLSQLCCLWNFLSMSHYLFACIHRSFLLLHTPQQRMEDAYSIKQTPQLPFVVALEQFPGSGGGDSQFIAVLDLGRLNPRPSYPHPSHIIQHGLPHWWAVVVGLPGEVGRDGHLLVECWRWAGIGQVERASQATLCILIWARRPTWTPCSFHPTTPTGRQEPGQALPFPGISLVVPQHLSAPPLSQACGQQIPYSRWEHCLVTLFWADRTGGWHDLELAWVLWGQVTFYWQTFWFHAAAISLVLALTYWCWCWLAGQTQPSTYINDDWVALLCPNVWAFF